MSENTVSIPTNRPEGFALKVSGSTTPDSNCGVYDIPEPIGVAKEHLTRYYACFWDAAIAVFATGKKHGYYRTFAEPEQLISFTLESESTPTIPKDVVVTDVTVFGNIGANIAKLRVECSTNRLCFVFYTPPLVNEQCKWVKRMTENFVKMLGEAVSQNIAEFESSVRRIPEHDARCMPEAPG